MKNCFLIVNYNDYKSTKHLIDNIIDYKCLEEIVIVDNGSKVEEKELLSTIKNNKITIIYNDENLGYSSGINIGAKYLIDKYEKCNLIISNSDIVILNEGDLEAMIELLNYDTIGLVGPQIIERGEISRGWKEPGVKNDVMLNVPIFHAWVKEKVCQYHDDYYTTPMSVVESLSTSFFLISSETMQKINYMDENVFLYYEDNILGQKVRDNGLLVVIDNFVKVKHNYSISVDKNTNLKKNKMLLDSQLYYHTNYHHANKFKRSLLIISAHLGNALRGKKNKNSKKKK